MDELKIGLIGPGEIAESHLLPALSRVSGGVLWGVAGRDHVRSTAIAKRFGAVHGHPGFGDWRNLLRCDALDAVIITTPDKLHARMAVAALEAGKHVFIEKPMATSMQEANAIREAADASGKTVAVGYHHRFHAGHVAMRDLIASGGIGTVRSFQGIWRYPSENGWRNQDATGRWWSLAMLGTHLIDLAWFFLGAEAGDVTETSAVTTAPVYGCNDEMASFTMKFAGGQIAEISVSVHGPPCRSIEVVGSEGIIRAPWTLGGSGKGNIEVFKEGFEDDSVIYVPVDPYVTELQDFVSAIRDGRSPKVGIDVGMKNVEWLCRAG